MKLGYARVTPNDQDLDIQIKALNDYGVDELYIERLTASSTNRPKLRELRKKLQKGDTIVIYSLDKLGITIKQLIYLTEGLFKKGIYLVSIKEKIIPNTDKGEYTYEVLDDLAQMEGNIVSERTKKGLREAKEKGKITGRPPVDEKKREIIVDMYFEKQIPVSEIIEATGLAKSTIYKYINIEKEDRKKKE